MSTALLESGHIRLDHLPAQYDFFEATERQVAFVGGLATGKTHVASDWILNGAVEYPRGRFGIFSNTYPQLTTGTLETFYERCEDWGLKYIPHVRDRHKVYLPDIPAVIEVWSADKPINYKSLELCRVWIDEAQAWEKHGYDMVLGRLRGTRLQRRIYPGMPLQLRITANPPHTFNHWLYELTHVVIDPRTGKPPIRLITAETYDNPFIPLDYIRDLEASYDPEIALAELRGQFIELGKGLAFRRFGRDKHIISAQEAQRRGIPPVEPDPNLPICLGQDFNLDPLCSILFQWRRLGNVPGYQRDVMYVLGELRLQGEKGRGALIQDVPQAFVERFPRMAAIARARGLILYGDASGNSGNRQTGQSDWAALKNEFARLGFFGDGRIPPADPSRHDRFAAANRMLEDTVPSKAPWSLAKWGHLGVAIAPDPALKFLTLDMTRMYFRPGTFQIEIPKAKPGEVLPPSRQMTHLGDAFSYPIAHDFPYVEPGGGGVTTMR